MGWQSYTITYTSKDEIKKITDAINHYQKIWNGKIETDEEIGEGIQGICFAKIKKVKTFKNKYIILFGIGGGRSYCEGFFSSRGIYLDHFCDNTLKYIEKSDSWYKYSNSSYEPDFEYFTDDFSEELEDKGFANLYSLDERKKAINYIKKKKDIWKEEMIKFSDYELNDIVILIQNNKKNVK